MKIEDYKNEISEGNNIDVTEFFSQEDWDSGCGSLSSETLEALGLEDVTRDERWFSNFESDGQRLGAYRDEDGAFWICWYVEDGKRYTLEFAANNAKEFASQF